MRLSSPLQSKIQLGHPVHYRMNALLLPPSLVEWTQMHLAHIGSERASPIRVSGGRVVGPWCHVCTFTHAPTVTLSVMLESEKVSLSLGARNAWTLLHEEKSWLGVSAPMSNGVWELGYAGYARARRLVIPLWLPCSMRMIMRPIQIVPHVRNTINFPRDLIAFMKHRCETY